MTIKSQPMKNEEGTAYLPNNIPPLVMEQFQGMNTYTTRPGVDDEQCWWIDGFMPINKRYLRTLYGPQISFTGTGTIVLFEFVNIGITPYCIIVNTDGSISALNTNTLTNTVIAAAGTISNPASTGINQYGSKYALIVSQQTNGYFIWDGTTFYPPGAAFPGGGTVPLAINGSAIETYQGRIWIVGGATLTFSAPGAVIDFTTANGGGSVTSTDSFLRVSYINLVQTNGFLYLIADSSVSYISGVQTSGTPPVTVFTLLNADPEVGTPWPATVTTFGRSVIFANTFGVHINYGAAVTKVSDPLNGVYNTDPNFGSIVPSSAKTILFGVKVWMLLIGIVDPFTGQQVHKLLIWDGKKWWASSQGVNLIYIQHQEINSVLTAWGTDGTSMYRLFATPSQTLTKVVQSKLWDKPIGYQMVKTVGRLYGLTQFFSLGDQTITVSIDNETGPSSTIINLSASQVIVVNASGAVIPVVNGTGSPVIVISGNTNIALLRSTAVGQVGSLLGMTVTTQAEDMAVISMMFQPEIGTGPG